VEDDFSGTHLGTIDGGLANFRSGLHAGEVLAGEAGFRAGTPNLGQPKGLAGQHRERERRAEDLTSAVFS